MTSPPKYEGWFERKRKKEMKILLSGFEPFGGSSINPSEQVLQALRNEKLSGVELDTCVLPVDCYRAPQLMIEQIRQKSPDVIIALGEAGGRPAISLERVAVNLLDYRIADNAGNMVQDLAIVEGAPDAYFSTLPLRILLKALEQKEIPAVLSLSAGAFLCNQIMYTILHQIRIEQREAKAGFIHLPYLPQQVLHIPQPSMSLDIMVSAMRIILRPEYYSF